METENRVKQHYAITDEGKIIHITKAHNTNEDVYCIQCGCKMIKKCGDRNAWHYAHNPYDILFSERECSYESYLHSLAKLKIKQWFERSSEIFINFKQEKYCALFENCIWKKRDRKCSKLVYDKYNLKKSLTECRVEEEIRVGREFFRPDLLWLNPKDENNKILVEIKVTHACSQSKIKSGARIIEFAIESEEDIDRIVSSNEIRKNNKVNFYGFRDTAPINDFNPQYNLLKYVQYLNGAVYPQSKCNCKDYSTRCPSSNVEITVRTENGLLSSNKSYKQISYSIFYKWCAAFINHIKGIPNCYLCKNRCFNDNNKLQCSIDKREIKGIKAQECDHYCLDIKYRDELFYSFKYYLSHNPIDIWIDGETYISG